MAPELISSYAVYLSYSEKGIIGQTFVSHLHGALKQEGVGTFKDDRSLEKGISIANDSFKAIEGSQIIVIVFSEKYAISKDCLDELVKIMECRKQLNKIVIPIFYDVEPSEVRNQTNSAFADQSENGHEEIGRSERVKRWREALKEAGNISGLDLRKTNDGNEADCIEQIVKEIVGKLRDHEIGEQEMSNLEEVNSRGRESFGFTSPANWPLCGRVFFFVPILCNGKGT